MMVVDGSLLLLFRCVDRMTELYLIVEGNSEFAPEDVFVREIVDSIRFCCVGGCGGKAMIETPLHFLVQCSKWKWYHLWIAHRLPIRLFQYLHQRLLEYRCTSGGRCGCSIANS